MNGEVEDAGHGFARVVMFTVSTDKADLNFKNVAYGLSASCGSTYFLSKAKPHMLLACMLL